MGFYRYAVDPAWRVPHFEKMLYDQAQLASTYAETYQATRDAYYRNVSRSTLDSMLRDLRSPAGAFYSAQDADSAVEAGKSELGEGVFYLWSADSIQQVLSAASAAVFNSYYGLEPPGILYMKRTPDRQSAPLVEAARKKRVKARTRRPAPGRDEKILTS